MTVPDDTDPEIGAHIVAIRDRFGVAGLRHAESLIRTEIAIFEDAYDGLPDLSAG